MKLFKRRPKPENSARAESADSDASIETMRLPLSQMPGQMLPQHPPPARLPNLNPPRHPPGFSGVFERD